MRDIRGDLRDRVNLLKEQIGAAQLEFERHIEHLKQDHDGRLKELRASLEAVNRLMGVEHRRLNGGPAAPEAKPQAPGPQPQGAHQAAQPQMAQPQMAEPQVAEPQVAQHQGAQPQGPQPQEAQPQLARPPQAPAPMRLADFLMRKLGEVGALTKDELCYVAVEGNYFPDSRSAEAAVNETLTQVVRAGFVRHLPNGSFALPALTDTIRLRRAG